MEQIIEIDKKLMNDIKSAATATGYSRDYITRLAREGKIVATQVGRNWYLDLGSLEQYAAVSTIEQQVKQRHLSDERRQERVLSERLIQVASEKRESVEKNSRQAKKVVFALLASFIFVGVGSSVLLAPIATSTKIQLASVPVAGGTAFADGTVLFGETEQTQVFSDEPVTTVFFARNDQGILLLPEKALGGEMLRAVDMFSDNVIVRVDSDGQMFIGPADKTGSSTGSEIPFVIVPSEKIESL